MIEAAPGSIAEIPRLVLRADADFARAARNVAGLVADRVRRTAHRIPDRVREPADLVTHGGRGVPRLLPHIAGCPAKAALLGFQLRATRVLAPARFAIGRVREGRAAVAVSGAAV